MTPCWYDLNVRCNFPSWVCFPLKSSCKCLRVECTRREWRAFQYWCFITVYYRLFIERRKTVYVFILEVCRMGIRCIVGTLPHASRLSWHGFIWKKKKLCTPHEHIGRRILFPRARVGWANLHVHIDGLSENGSALGDVKGIGERHSGTARAQRTAEMKSERRSVCMPLDLISPTCPCHSDSPRSKQYQPDLSICPCFNQNAVGFFLRRELCCFF